MYKRNDSVKQQRISILNTDKYCHVNLFGCGVLILKFEKKNNVHNLAFDVIKLTSHKIWYDIIIFTGHFSLDLIYPGRN